MTPNSLTILSMPPRHGKTYLASHYAPPWYLGNFPTRRAMLSSYSAELAEGFGRKARDVLARRGPDIFGVSVSSDSRAANRWEVALHGGEMYSIGVGGVATGRGFDLGIIDDYIKNSEEALSPVIRQKIWDWYVTSWITRRQPGASEIIVATRWHSDDLIGRLLEESRHGGRPVREIRLPAIAEADDPIGRQPGESLWPEMYPIEKLREIERTQAFWFSALYQQRPVPMGGTLFRADWFKQFDWITEDGPGYEGLVVGETGTRYMHGRTSRHMFVDPSLGQKNSDRVAIGIFGLPDDAQQLFTLWMTSERIPLEQIIPRLDRLARAWRVDSCCMEANGFQVQLAKSARAVLPCPVREIDPEGKSKLVRGIPAVELCHAGDLLVPESAPWLSEYIAELCNWTGSDGDRDDQVDVTAYAVRELLTARDGGDERPSAGSTKAGWRR